MTPRSLARRYAGALFDVVQKGGTVEAADRDLAAIAELIAGHEPLRKVFQSSGVPPHKKRAVLEAILAASGEVTGEVRRLLLLLADRNRLGLVPEIAGTFAERAMAARRVVSADLVTSAPLGDARRAAVAEALGRASGCEVTLRERVDPSIIGGIVARIGSVVYDGSVTRQLEKMRQRLLRDQ
jgi:F-type H+-transporting ATPase subunit delta